VQARCTFVNANVKQAVAEVGIMQYLKTYRVPGDVSDKDHAGAVKDVFAVDCDFDGGKFVSPEGPPQRPEIIEMA
jgi:hypothetical protein